MPAIFIEGTRIRIVTGQRTQTVNVCSDRNLIGDYQKSYRISAPERFVTPDTLGGCRTLSELDDFLKARDNALIVEDRSTNPVPTPVPIRPAGTTAGARSVIIPSASAFSTTDPAEAAWLDQARAQVEAAIDQFVLHFIRFPYAHRVEHSIHMALAGLLNAQSALTGLFPIGRQGEDAGLIHKEWPETTARPENGNRRGNFDFGILSPQSLARCASLEEYRQGRIPAQIAVEIGLDYPYDHLKSDHDKVINSNVPFAYLIHLVRSDFRDPRVEDLAVNPQTGSRIRTAYVLIQGGRAFFKLVNGDRIVEVERIQSSEPSPELVG